MSSDLQALQPHQRGREFTIPYSVGIELEVEFDGAPPPFASSPNLHFKQDGSLTNGVEMVFRHPFPKTKLQEPADEMIGAIEGALTVTGGRVVLSPRAGTHFHVNVVGQTPLAAARAWMLMCALEPKLFELFPTRKENIFCLPSFMADRPLMELARAFGSNYNVLGWSNDMGHFRYSATNPAAIARFGSIEMRMVPTMVDSKKMARWGLAFANIVQTGCELSSKDFYTSVADLSWLNRIVEERSPIDMPNVDTPVMREHLDKIRWCSEKLFLHERRLTEKKRRDKNLLHLGRASEIEMDYFTRPEPMHQIDRSPDDMMFMLVEEGRNINRFGMDELRTLVGRIENYATEGPSGPEEEFFGRYSSRQMDEVSNSIWNEIERRENAQRRADPPRPRFPAPPRPLFRAADWSTQAQMVAPGWPEENNLQAANNLSATDVERAMEAMRAAAIIDPPVIVGQPAERIVTDEIPDIFEDDDLDPR